MNGCVTKLTLEKIQALAGTMVQVATNPASAGQGVMIRTSSAMMTTICAITTL